MRILVITPGFLPTIGGAEIGAHEIYSRLASKHDVFILTQAVKNAPMRLPGFDMTRYRIIRYRDWLNLGRIPGRMLLRGLVPPFSLGATTASIRTISQLRPDVVNVHYAIYTGLAAIWAKKVSRVPTVLSLIGRDAAPGPQVPKLWHWYARQIAKNIRQVIFISEFCRKYHPPSIQSTVIPYGVNTRMIYPKAPDRKLQEELNIPPGKFVIFSLQRLAAIKRPGFQLQIARSLVEAGVNDFLLLIGGSGPEQATLEKQSQVLNLEDYVRFLGFIPEEAVAEYFALADIFLMTSAYETFGIVLAQALSAGLPVVAFNNSAIPEVVQDGENGLLAPDGDISAMVDNILRLKSQGQLRDKMSMACRQRALDYYDWDKIVAQYEIVLETARH